MRIIHFQTVSGAGLRSVKLSRKRPIPRTAGRRRCLPTQFTPNVGQGIAAREPRVVPRTIRSADCEHIPTHGQPIREQTQCRLRWVESRVAISAVCSEVAGRQVCRVGQSPRYTRTRRVPVRAQGRVRKPREVGREDVERRVFPAEWEATRTRTRQDSDWDRSLFVLRPNSHLYWLIV